MAAIDMNCVAMEHGRVRVGKLRGRACAIAFNRDGSRSRSGLINRESTFEVRPGGKIDHVTGMENHRFQGKQRTPWFGLGAVGVWQMIPAIEKIFAMVRFRMTGIGAARAESKCQPNRQI